MEKDLLTRRTSFRYSPEKNMHPAETPGLDLDTIYQAPSRQRILIVDDDAETLHLLKEIMRLNGFDVVSASGAADALRKTSEVEPDIILLDVMMPEVDGWETYLYLREVTNAPVIIVSALTDKEEIVKGLKLGVDDYVTKPFFNDEVVARVRAVLRRANSAEQATTLVFPTIQLVINFDTQEVTLRDKPVHLTSKEFSVLAVLAKRAPRNVGYETISREVWGEDSPSARKRIKYLVYLLRQKIEKDPGNPKLLRNNGAFGYKLQTSAS